MNNLEKAPSHKNVIILDTVLTCEKKQTRCETIHSQWSWLCLEWTLLALSAWMAAAQQAKLSDGVIQELCREILKEKCLF